jgi:hypothetical protein
MKVDKIRDIEDINKCINLYMALNDDSFLKASYEKSYKNMFQVVRMNKFLRVIRDDDSIIAWVFADKINLLHYDKPIFQQIYYASNQKGIKSVRCIRLLHEAMIEEAKRLNISTVISLGSHLDPDYIFTKILEKSGWKRRGYVALYEIE